MPHQPLPNGLGGGACRIAIAPTHPHERHRSRQSSASHASTPASRCSGDGSGGQRQTRRAPARSITSTAEPGCSETKARCRCGGESERLVIAADEHVLAVVDALAGRRIGERGGAPAQRRPRLEDEHAAPRSASAVAALRPAKPPPMTMTSVRCQCSTLESGLGRRRRRAPSVVQPDAKAISARCGRGTRMRA